VTNEERARAWLAEAEYTPLVTASLTALLDTVQAEERERCAATCEETAEASGSIERRLGAMSCARRIRERGKP
jgi:hypothetical protein